MYKLLLDVPELGRTKQYLSQSGPRFGFCVVVIFFRLARVERLLKYLSKTQQFLASAARRQLLNDVDLPPAAELRSHRFGLYSQNEEDGLILELFKRVGTTDRRFAEIGCGVNGGNSGFLLSE